MDYQKCIADLDAAARDLIESHPDRFMGPADGVHVVTAYRAVQTVGAFQVLMANGGFSVAVNLVRQLLDNLIRLHGITTQPDPHKLAWLLFQGTPLSSLKDANNPKEKLRDAYLKELMADAWVSDTYAMCSDYVHLSARHFGHLLAASDSSWEGIVISPMVYGDGHVPQDVKDELIAMFEQAAARNVAVVRAWIGTRFDAVPNDHAVAKWGNNQQKWKMMDINLDDYVDFNIGGPAGSN